jgi:hypothetical protein
MAISPNGKLLALFTAQGVVEVVTADFQRRLSEFQADSVIPPRQLVWYAR